MAEAVAFRGMGLNLDLVKLQIATGASMKQTIVDEFVANHKIVRDLDCTLDILVGLPIFLRYVRFSDRRMGVGDVTVGGFDIGVRILLVVRIVGVEVILNA